MIMHAFKYYNAFELRIELFINVIMLYSIPLYSSKVQRLNLKQESSLRRSFCFKPKFRLFRYSQCKMTKNTEKGNMQSCWRFLKTQADGCLLVFGTKTSVPVNKSCCFKPSMSRHSSVCLPSHTPEYSVFCVREFNRRESWAQTPHFYR